MADKKKNKEKENKLKKFMKQLSDALYRSATVKVDIAKKMGAKENPMKK